MPAPRPDITSRPMPCLEVLASSDIRRQQYSRPARPFRLQHGRDHFGRIGRRYLPAPSGWDWQPAGVDPCPLAHCHPICFMLGSAIFWGANMFNDDEYAEFIRALNHRLRTEKRHMTDDERRQ